MLANTVEIVGQDGILRPVGSRRCTGRWASSGRRVTNPPPVPNLPHKPAASVTVFCEPQ